MDTEPAAEMLVAAYLDRLRQAARPLPPARRDELLAEVREHIETAVRVDRQSGSGEVVARNVLDRLGPPEEIVQAETEGMPYVVVATRHEPAPAPSQPTGPWGALEIAGLVMLVVGAVLLPVFGSLVGLVLVWLSPRWTPPQKLVATGVALLPLLVIASYRVSGR